MLQGNLFAVRSGSLRPLVCAFACDGTAEGRNRGSITHAR